MTPLFAASIYWHLPVLLVTFSLVYSATRHDRWDRILWEAAGWAGRVLWFLANIGVTLWGLAAFPDRWYAVFGVSLAVNLAVWYATTDRAKRPEG